MRQAVNKFSSASYLNYTSSPSASATSPAVINSEIRRSLWNKNPAWQTSFLSLHVVPRSGTVCLLR